MKVASFLAAAILTCSAAIADDQPLLDMSAFDDVEVKIGVSVATEHVGAERDFNETNPGAFITVWKPFRRIGGDMGVEAGIFENSFSDISTTLNAWMEWPVLGGPDAILGQFNLGGAFGIARYPNLVDEAEDLGLPTLANFVPFAALQATWLATDRLEMRARATPIGGDADFVVGLQIFLRL